MSNEHAPSHGHADEHEHHIVPVPVYVGTLVALTVLMLLTVWVSYFNLPAIGPLSGTVVNQTVALLIAIVKGLLVISIFMGVWWSTKLTKLWVLAGFAVFFLMFIIFGDYAMRKYEPVPSWDPSGESTFPREFTPGNKIIPNNNNNFRPRG